MLDQQRPGSSWLDVHFNPPCVLQGACKPWPNDSPPQTLSPARLQLHGSPTSHAGKSQQSSSFACASCDVIFQAIAMDVFAAPYILKMKVWFLFRTPRKAEGGISQTAWLSMYTWYVAMASPGVVGNTK